MRLILLISQVQSDAKSIPTQSLRRNPRPRLASFCLFWTQARRRRRWSRPPHLPHLPHLPLMMTSNASKRGRSRRRTTRKRRGKRKSSRHRRHRHLINLPQNQNWFYDVWERWETPTPRKVSQVRLNTCSTCQHVHRFSYLNISFSNNIRHQQWGQ